MAFLTVNSVCMASGSAICLAAIANSQFSIDPKFIEDKPALLMPAWRSAIFEIVVNLCLKFGNFSNKLFHDY
ncbi:hypothetical protein [Microcoleus sp. herbarium12]|uniref:hypothetical protein n=1 Tax=Microcoleus sp. herbarium12 TaxID=3055437 RepID=UPI002FD273DA